jgi:hypothetical protein
MSFGLPLALLLWLGAAAAAPTGGGVEPSPCVSPVRQRLDTGWVLDNAVGFGNVTLRGVAVPAYALGALRAAGQLGDPLYRCAHGDACPVWVVCDLVPTLVAGAAFGGPSRSHPT